MVAQKTVTASQLDACNRVIDEAKHEVFYLVQSATDPAKTYQVRHHRQYNRLSCTCKANQQGMSCWHIRAVYEVARQYAEAKRAEAEARTRRLAEAKANEMAELEARVMSAMPVRYREEDIKAAQKRFQPNPFSLLR